MKARAGASPSNPPSSADGTLRFERLYASFNRPILTDANGAVQRSADRYIEHIGGLR